MRLQRQIVFDPFSLDLANERLCRGKQEIRLHPKAFAVLRYLIERPRGLVTKDTLLEKVWPGLHVTEGVLTESIREIRKALGDDSKKPHFIGTVHRRGYRFLAAVTNGSQTSSAMTKQEIRFCSTVDGVRIAYSTMGKGPPLVIPPQLVTHLEADLVEGPLADVYEALARHYTLVRFDLRGTGLSDRNVSLSSEELFILDLEAVVDELGLQLFPLYGLCGGGRLALHYYSRNPARVSHLIFYGTDPEASGDERKKQRNVTHAVIQASWKVGSKLTMEHLMPHGGTREDIERLARWLQISVASDVAQRLIELRQDRSDLGPLLAKVSVPTLVIHRRGDHVPFVGGRELAAKIRGARFLPLEGYNHLPATHEEAMELVTPVVEFIAKGQDSSGALSVEGVPITLLFTDIEGSSSLTTRLGAKEVQKLVQAHNDTVRRAIESYNGNEVKYTGKGIGASFFSASRAVGCALHIQQALVKRNAANPEDAVNVRVGVTVGEPIVDDNDPFSASAQVARQICELAKPGQVLVSDLVRQLVDGKGFAFEPLDVRTLKGFDEPVALYRLHVDSITSGFLESPR
jgi:class 3 adenylate cyclase/DNA-binding winged helix-turn-helix (wHTH) protein